MMASTPLGKHTEYVDTYSPDLLFPIARQTAGMWGKDIWTCYEVSWLNQDGLPQLGVLVLDVPADSSHIVESKSLKLYLNGFNQEKIADTELVDRVQQDLSRLLDCDQIKVSLLAAGKPTVQAFEGVLLDQLEVTASHYDIEASLLQNSADSQQGEVEEALVTHLFRSNCPVTNQPDWASVLIRYQGQAIDHASLLAYLVSYRKHQGFHEQCVETIYRDIWQQCQPQQLMVYARFLRRGGIDINPLRTSCMDFASDFLAADAWRQVRQ